jgi:hypothetical protein
MEGYVAGLNGDYVYRLEKLMPEGDESCVWSIERRAG